MSVVEETGADCEEDVTALVFSDQDVLDVSEVVLVAEAVRAIEGWFVVHSGIVLTLNILYSVPIVLR